MDGMNPTRLPVIGAGKPRSTPAAGKAAVTDLSFKEMLQTGVSQSKTESLTFSKHAKVRTEQRGLSLSQTDMNRLDNAVGKARDKGLTDTLVFMDNTAFIVNVPNKVVVTVVDGTDNNNVFTNIDGAVIA